MKTKVLKVQSENQWFQRAEVLKRNRKKRTQHRQFFVEGVSSINQLVDRNEWTIEALLYTPDRPLSNWARTVLAKASAHHRLELSAPLLDKLSDKEDPSELLAIVAIPADDPGRIPIRPDALIALADRPANPGNLGTLIRSCEAFGVDGLVITGHAADLYDPRTIRAATGSLFALPTTHISSQAELSRWLDQIRCQIPTLQIVGTSARGATPLANASLTAPTLLIIGNEASGLSQRCREYCDQIVAIPMAGQMPSLNMASAAAVFLYEIQRQRRSVHND